MQIIFALGERIIVSAGAKVRIRVCNPGTVFSIPGSGIEKFPIPGSRDWK